MRLGIAPGCHLTRKVPLSTKQVQVPGVAFVDSVAVGDFVMAMVARLEARLRAYSAATQTQTQQPAAGGQQSDREVGREEELRSLRSLCAPAPPPFFRGCHGGANRTVQ